MSKQVKPAPEKFHSVTPYLMVDGANELIDFMKQAFEARETMRLKSPNGLVMHAELQIGDSIIMICDAQGDRKSIPAGLYVYVKDPDLAYKRALDAGATSLMPVTDQFYGDRMGCVQDSLGNTWWIAKHVEDLAPEELKRRAEKAMCERAELAGVRQ